MPRAVLEIVSLTQTNSSDGFQTEEMGSNQSEGSDSGSEFVPVGEYDQERDPDDGEQREVDETSLPAEVSPRSLYVRPPSLEHSQQVEDGRIVDVNLPPTRGQSECSQSEVDGLLCTICMQAWTNDGEHSVSCLPCGHLYGMSCINKWLKQCRNSGGKCPQCNRKCMLKDVRKLYASRIVAVDEESVRNVKMLESKCAFLEDRCSVIEEYCHSLEEKCEFLQKKCVSYDLSATTWSMKECQWRTKEMSLQQQVQQLTERATYLQQLLGGPKSRPLGSVDFEDGIRNPFTPGHMPDSTDNGMRSTCSFTLHEEFGLEGARNFDMDSSNSIAIVAGRIPGKGGIHFLSKMSLVVPHDTDRMHLPSTTNVIKDLRISPNGRLALLASLGKKLHILSMGNNNVVVCYDLPAAAWSCAWDVNNSHFLYAGLQNGLLLLFDMRRTVGPVEIMTGLSSNPVHTIYSTLSSSSRAILSASSAGLCRWNFDGSDKGPHLVPEAGRQAVCISLASDPDGGRIVASFRPRVGGASEEPPPATQQRCTQSSSGGRVQGAHVLLERAKGQWSGFRSKSSAAAMVDDIRLPKTAIVEGGEGDLLFASTDGDMCGTVLHELPSFDAVQNLRSPGGPVRDLKYTTGGMLGCLTDGRLQLFSPSHFTASAYFVL